MNTLSRMARGPEPTSAEFDAAWAWAEPRQAEVPIACAYCSALVALGTALEIEPDAIAAHWPAERGHPQPATTRHLIGGAVNPLFELRTVLARAVLAEMAK